MAPLRLPKVASNRFRAFGDQTKSERTEKKLFIPRCCPYSDSAARDYAVCIMAERKKILLVSAGVPLSEFAVQWLPCGCQKLHPNVFWHLDAISVRKKAKNIIYSSLLPVL
jgi:hypothetical protein